MAAKPKMTQPRFHIGQTDRRVTWSGNFFNNWTFYKKKSVHAVFLPRFCLFTTMRQKKIYKGSAIYCYQEYIEIILGFFFFEDTKYIISKCISKRN